MTWTYNSSNLSNSSKDAVRLWTGDVSSGDQLLSNEEINYILNNVTANVILASAECCELIAASFARKADTQNEGLAVKASQRAQAYERRAKELRARRFANASIFVGGRSVATKNTREKDSDYVQPAFTRGQDDYEEASATST